MQGEKDITENIRLESQEYGKEYHGLDKMWEKKRERE